ncbi:reticulon-4-like isoform X6 [Hypanus sabinus]|uniref:reticulon-4-like isoform X6 n=1 Tax=Hypanus sabinus TaxID=79690 RepID=UPI0028C432B3|nr:reticulon-4-like isoform X6 [Hypanus sabinus]
MSEEFQSSSVSSSVRQDDILEDTRNEGVEKAPDDLQPPKPGAGDAPVVPPVVLAAQPVPEPRTSEPAECSDEWQDDSPPLLPARSRPEPDSTSETGAATELARKRPESMDKPFFSPVAHEYVMQPADFSVDLKDQPSGDEPVGSQDAVPVHVEPVPVFSMSSSSDSITELTMSTKAVHADDLVQTEVPANTILPSISDFVEETVDKQVADHLEKVHSKAEKAGVKLEISKSSEVDLSLSVDEYSLQSTERQCVESKKSESHGTTSLSEETMPDQNTTDMEGPMKVSKNASIEVNISSEREFELGLHLGLTNECIAESKMAASPLNRIVQKNEYIQDIVAFEEQIEATDSGLNFGYGDTLVIEKRNELNSGTSNQVAITDDTSKSTIEVIKSESAVYQSQELLKMPHDTEKRILTEESGKLDHVDVEAFVEQGAKQSPTEAYFAFSQVPTSEPEPWMTYATFDSSNMLVSPQSDHLSNEMISAYDAADREKTELTGTSKLPLPLTVLESEVTKKVEDKEAKFVPLVESGLFPESKVEATSASEINLGLFGDFKVVPDQHIKTNTSAEDITSNQTAQNLALDQSPGISKIELCEVASVETPEDSFGIEMRKSVPELLNPCEPLLSTLEKCAPDTTENVQGLTDVTMKAPSRTDPGLDDITEPGYAKEQSVAQNGSKEPAVHVSVHGDASESLEGTKIQCVFEEQKAMPNRVEDLKVSSEQIPISQESDLTEHLADSSNKPVIKDEDLYKKSGYKESDVSQSINQSVNESSKQDLISSKIMEEEYCPTSLTLKQGISTDTSIMVKRHDIASCSKDISSKSEPIMGALGNTTIGMKPSENILTDYKKIEQCSLKTSLQDQIENPLLIKNVTEDDLTGQVKVTDRTSFEIMLSHQEACGELLPSSSTSEKCAVKESNHSLSENIGTSIPLSVLSENLSTVDRGLPLQTCAEESCLDSSQTGALSVTPSQDKFPEYEANLSKMKSKSDDQAELLEHAQVQIIAPILSAGASFPLNEEVTKASQEVVTKVLETSVALAEVLGEKEGTRATCMSQQEADITTNVPMDDTSKKNIPVETLKLDLTVAESTETSKDSAVAVIADISLKLDKNSVVDLIYWRDIKKTGLVFGASLFLLLSMTIFSIVSVIAYLGLAVLSVTISFRIYKGILQAVQKSDDGHPFKACLEKDVAVSDELVHKYSDIGLGHVNYVITELRRLFLVQDLVDSLKFTVLMWLLTYVGALFNGLTLLIIALVAVFSIPVVYERHQAQIDHYIGIASKQIKDVTAKIQAKVPGLKKKTE